MLLAQRVFPERQDRIHYEGPADIRRDIARTVPAYEAIRELRKKGDNFQWGGAYLCKDYRFNTPDGKAHFAIPELPEVEVPEGRFLVSTRRGKQFNSMVWKDYDSLTGADRDGVFMAAG